MHILVVNQSGGLYGIERMLLALLPAMAASGLRITFMALCSEADSSATLARLLEAKGISVHYVPVGRFLGVRGVTRIASIIRECAPDIVHVHGYKAAIGVGLVRRMLRVRTVATVHSESATESSMNLGLIAEWFFYKRFDRLVAVSRGVLRDAEARGVDPLHVSVIPNGITDRSWHSRQRDPSLIVAVGRLVAVKRFDAVIRALASLRTAGYTAKLCIVGDGPLRAELEALADDLGVNDSVIFTGFVQDVTPVLSQAEIFAMPSASEGSPMALLEAMSAGCAIVASRVGGIPDTVRDEQEALLVDPADEPALRIALERLLRDKELRDRLAAGARSRFLAEFDVQRIALRYIDVYRDLAGLERQQGMRSD